MHILAQFLLRLAFGLAVGMGITSSEKVSSGFFRNHLYVTLGLNTLAALVLVSQSRAAMCLAVLAAIVSYAGAVAWLYEQEQGGKALIWLVAICSLGAALLTRSASGATPHTGLWNSLGIVTSGLVLGLTFAAMLLGHWYLNAPGMELEPLRLLLIASAAAVGAQAFVVAIGLVADVFYRSNDSTIWPIFVLMRWLFGILGVVALLRMAWKTLEIPNTQSATGILYVAVLGVFTGELTGLLLSATSAYPL